MSENAVVLNPVVMNDDLSKAIAAALDPNDIKAAILSEAEKQTAAATETATAEKLAADAKVLADKTAADAAAAQPSVFTRTEIIGGKEFTFEASSELELERSVNNALRVAYAVQTPAEPVVTVDPAVAAAAAQKESEEKATRLADLELKWKQGSITAAEYIEQSGAVDDYLAKKGVPLESLKAALDKNQNAEYENSWAQATEDFKHSPAGQDWPGGKRNVQQIGLQIVALGLQDAEDKVAAIAKAYAEMKKTDMIFANEDAVVVPTDAEKQAAVATQTAAAQAAAAQAQAQATAAAELAAAKKPATASSLFGASSGVGAGSTGTPAPATGKVDVPADASPAEILDAWKKAQVAAGKNPDDAFRETFSVRR